MSRFKWLAVIIASSLVLVSGYTLSRSTHDAASAKVSSFTSTVAAAPSNGLPSTAATNRYQLDASRSKFIAHALAGGLFWFKGHDHLVAVRDFTGEAVLDPDAVANSSLQITAKAASMEETDRKSTRLNSSHDQISYAVFCLKKKKNHEHITGLERRSC